MIASSLPSTQSSNLEDGTRSIRGWIVPVVVALVWVVAAGCDSPEASGEAADKQAGQMDSGGKAKAAGLVAEAGEIEVTMSDYERFLKRSRLFAPADDDSLREIPKRRKTHPRVQSRTVQSLLENALVRREAKRRGLEVSDGEIESFLQSHGKLSRFVETGREAGADASTNQSSFDLPDGLTRADLRKIARTRLLREKLRESLLAGIDDEEIWQFYQERHDKVRIAYVSTQNTPTPEEIDTFVEETPVSRFERYLDEHAQRYHRPELVELAVVRPQGGDEVDKETLKKAAEQLKTGGSAKDVASRLGLTFEESTYLIRKENPEAFRADKGTTGYQISGPRGAYAWRVEGRRKGGEPKLDGGLKREVASALLQESLVDSARETLQPVLEAMREVERGPDGAIPDGALESLKEELAAQDLSLETAMIARAGGNSVSGLGLAESVIEAAFDLDDVSPPVVDKPVLSRGRAVALTQVERHKADREDFEADKESFRKKIVEEKKHLIVRDFVNRRLAELEPNIKMEPIREKYGVMQKKP